MDNDAAMVHLLIDGEVIRMVLHRKYGIRSDDNDDDDQHVEKVSIDECISLCERLINGLEQRSFTTEQRIISVL